MTGLTGQHACLPIFPLLPIKTKTLRKFKWQSELQALKILVTLSNPIPFPQQKTQGPEQCTQVHLCSTDARLQSPSAGQCFLTSNREREVSRGTSTSKSPCFPGAVCSAGQAEHPGLECIALLVGDTTGEKKYPKNLHQKLTVLKTSPCPKEELASYTQVTLQLCGQDGVLRNATWGCFVVPSQTWMVFPFLALTTSPGLLALPLGIFSQRGAKPIGKIQ